MYAFVIIAVLALAGKKRPVASTPAAPAPAPAPAPIVPAPTTSAIVVAPASTPVATIPIVSTPEPTAIVIAPKQTIATLITEAVQAPTRPQIDSKTLACIFVDREEPVKLSTPVNTNKKGGKTKRNKRSIKNLIAEQVLA
jgi:hypothetical protein